MTTWYEVRADYEWVAEFPRSDDFDGIDDSGEALKQAHDIVKKNRHDLWRDKVLQIVLCSRQESYIPWEELGFVDEKLIHEEHPTVLEIESFLAKAQKNEFRI